MRWLLEERWGIGCDAFFLWHSNLCNISGQKYSILVTMHEHPRLADLLQDINAADEAIGSWEGSVFRAVELQWARPGYLISGEGTRKHGSRWMQAGLTRVAHAALTEGLAIKESRKVFKYYGIRKPRNTPRVSVEIEIRFHYVLNLTSVERVFTNLTTVELLSEDWEKVNGTGRETLSRAIGRAAWKSKLEAMLVPSARDRRTRNLIWFPDNLQKNSMCRISGGQELEMWLAE